ncbi:hypothetical protein [Parendozoicomonas haliclonae]|uniref:Uncharacterized protein n=1 Tax=Parendozoicomonas haliclonae TaxID=1960125 RepID=A0A1X7AFJ1_9GAMM|nr:hypothetical protein [Parendozoicomonas haliclonae]SMA37945.1 hypothetical protein EHSB41UT_00809 [Parendozoicomonas haliclonae]
MLSTLRLLLPALLLLLSLQAYGHGSGLCSTSKMGARDSHTDAMEAMFPPEAFVLTASQASAGANNLKTAIATNKNSGKQWFVKIASAANCDRMKQDNELVARLMDTDLEYLSQNQVSIVFPEIIGLYNIGNDIYKIQSFPLIKEPNLKDLTLAFLNDAADNQISLSAFQGESYQTLVAGHTAFGKAIAALAYGPQPTERENDSFFEKPVYAPLADRNPGNQLYNRETGELWLIDVDSEDSEKITQAGDLVRLTLLEWRVSKGRVMSCGCECLTILYQSFRNGFTQYLSKGYSPAEVGDWLDTQFQDTNPNACPQKG